MERNHTDMLVKGFTPNVPAFQVSHEAVNLSGKIQQVAPQYYFTLKELWEILQESSIFGLGVPLVLEEISSEPVVQYFTPYLSGIQLYRYVDPIIRRFMFNAAQLDSPEELIFQYLEYEPPHMREHLSEKVSKLAANYPNLEKLRSCDLSPSSWLSITWCPIYRIPMGDTMKKIDTSFLTFHTLSTVPANFQGLNGRNVSKFLLPVIGMVAHKLEQSPLMPKTPNELHQAQSLFRAAETWLQKVQVHHPDFHFYVHRSRTHRA